MDTNTLKRQLLDLRAQWAKAPMTTRLMAGAYMEPLLELLENMIYTMENATHGNS